MPKKNNSTNSGNSSNENKKKKIIPSFAYTAPSNNNSISFISNKPKTKLEISNSQNEAMSFIQKKNDKKDNFQIGHPNQQLTFICNGHVNNNNNLQECNNQNFMYGQDAATGAQIYQQDYYRRF